MATGKQLSFQFGEVSPMQQYKAGDVFFQSALRRAKNFYVRRSGGVSNRPGFIIENVETPFRRSGQEGRFYSLNNVLNFYIQNPTTGVWEYKYYIPLVDKVLTKPSAKTFQVWNSYQSSYMTVEVLKAVPIDSAQSSPHAGIIFAKVDFITTLVLHTFDTIDVQDFYSYDISRIGVTVAKEKLVFTPGAFPSNNHPDCVSRFSTAEFYIGGQQVTVDPLRGDVLTFDLKTNLVSLLGLNNYKFTGYSNSFKAMTFSFGTIWRSTVTYAICGVTEEGQEIFIDAVRGGYDVDPVTGGKNPKTNNTDGLDYVLPGSTAAGAITNRVVYTWNPAIRFNDFHKVVSLNFYRSSTAWDIARPVTVGSQINLVHEGAPLLSLCYRVDVSDQSVRTIYFDDAGASDSSVTAPTNVNHLAPEDRAYIPSIGVDPIAYPSRFESHKVIDANSSVFYQERLILGMNPFSRTFAPKLPVTNISAVRVTFRGVVKAEVAPGEVLASKLGVPNQFSMPQVIRPTEAFRFSTPINDGTKVVGWLGGERLVALTERGAYLIQGGQNGGLTPTTINPVQISSDGCSPTITPVMCGSLGFYVSNDHTKLIMIGFGDQSNAIVRDASKYSGHLVDETIVDMVAVAEEDQAVYLLRADGVLIRITVADTGEVGFSTVELAEGLQVEGIFAKRAIRGTQYQNNHKDSLFHEVLGIQARKGDIRFIGRLDKRSETEDSGENFVDVSQSWGSRLEATRVGYLRYTKLPLGNLVGIPDPFHPYVYGNAVSNYCNLESNTWGEGEAVTLRTMTEVAPFSMIKFFYDKGKKVALATVIGTSESADPVNGFEFSSQVIFTDVVPEELRDIWGSDDPTTSNDIVRRRRSSHWLPMISHLRFIDLEECPCYLIDDSSNVDRFSYVPNGQSGSQRGFTRVLQDTNFEDKPVSVIADGQVLSSPLNPEMEDLNLVYVGQQPPVVDPSDMELYPMELDLQGSFAHITYGLPVEAEIESLPIEPSDGRTLMGATKNLNSLGLGVVNTRGGWVGTSKIQDYDFVPLYKREDLDLGNTNKNYTGFIEVPAMSNFNLDGTVIVKHVDPTPVTITALYPTGVSAGSK